jgi:hypothetical protein
MKARVSVPLQKHDLPTEGSEKLKNKNKLKKSKFLINIWLL